MSSASRAVNRLCRQCRFALAHMRQMKARLFSPSRSMLSGYRCCSAEQLEPRLLLSGTNYIVTSLADVVASDGVVTLREAIEAANTNTAVTADVLAGSDVDTDTISFDAGLWSSGPAKIVLVGTQLTVTDALAIEGPGGGKLTISGNFASRVLYCDATDLSMTGLKVSFGYAYMGAGIYNDQGTVTLTGCEVSGNQVYYYDYSSGGQGGGIYSNRGAVTLIDSAVTDNRIYSLGVNEIGAGGGIWAQFCYLTLTNSTVHGNYAEIGGGGIHIQSRGSLTITGGEVSGNYGGNGGGIYISDEVPVELTGVRITGNRAEDGDGGGIANSNPLGTMVLTNVIVSSNHSQSGGGGIYSSGPATLTDCWVVDNYSQGYLTEGGGGIHNFSTMTIVGSMIRGNQAGYASGGGICNLQTLTVVNSVVADNWITGWYSDEGGGGIFTDSGALPVSLTNCTIAGNYVTLVGPATAGGGGVYIASGPVTINNTVVALNQAPSYPDVGGTYVGSNNIIGGDPGFVAQPGDLRPTAVSPLVDAGDNALAVDADGLTLVSDVHGDPRIAFGTVDIGAYEYGGPAVVVTFVDWYLDAAIRDALGRPMGDILDTDLAVLTDLDVHDLRIVNLAGLEYCTNLTSLGLSANQIVDLSPLSGLTGLASLDLSANQIIDLSPLSGLMGLTNLDLSSNQISDLSPLTGLTGLTSLDIGHNPLWPSSYTTEIPALEAAGTVVTYDAPGRISGTVFDDQNNNCVRDAGEPGMAGVIVFLDSNSNNVLDWVDTDGQADWDQGEGERWTTSGADGSYTFDNEYSYAGGHRVLQVVPAGWRQATSGAPARYDVYLVGNEVVGLDFGLSDELGPLVSIEMIRFTNFLVPGRTDDSHGYQLAVTGIEMTGGQLITPWGETVEIDDLLPESWSGRTHTSFDFELGAFDFEASAEGVLTTFSFEWDWLSENQWASLDTGTTTLVIEANTGDWADALDFSGASQVPDEPNILNPIHRTILPHDFLVEWSPWIDAPADGVIVVGLEMIQADGQPAGEEYEEYFELPADATSWAPPAGLDLDGMLELQVFFAAGTQQTLIDDVPVDVFSYGGNDVICLVGDFDGPVVTEPGTGRQYFITPVGSWESCQAYAQVHGGNLVTIESAEQEAWLRSELGANGWYWIGLNDRAVEGQWEWADGQAVTYTNWGSGQPSGLGWNNGEADAAVWVPSTGQWYDSEEWFGFRGIAQTDPGQWLRDDHGNSDADATPVPLSVSTTGWLGYNGDIDYFSFSAVGGTLYEMTVEADETADLDTVAWLYDDSGTLLTWDDDGGENDSSRILWAAPADGTYYLAVDSSGPFEDVEQYSVQIESDTLMPDSPDAIFNHAELLLFANGTRGVAFSSELYTGSTSDDVGGVLHVLDLSDPLAPVEVGSWYAMGVEGIAFGPHGFIYCVVGDIETSTGVSSELVALDISGGGDPMVVYRTKLQREDVDSLAVVGNVAYVGTQSNYNTAAMEIYDLSSSSEAILLGQVEWASPDGSDFDPGSIVVVDGVAYVLHEGRTVLSIVDVSDPLSPAFLGQYAASLSEPEPWGLAVADGMAWIGVGNELRGIDISTPASPTFRSSMILDGKVEQIQIQGLVACVGCVSSGVAVVDVSNPDVPSILRTVVTPGATGSVALSDGFIFVPTFGDMTAIFSDTISPAVVDRHIFYNRSHFDGNDAAANGDDDNAIDTGKQALRSGQAASPANCTSYSRGINGIMVDLANTSIASVTVSDFVFRVGDGVGPWDVPPAPASVTSRPGAGSFGRDRVTLIWADGDISDCWLEVTVLSDANGGSLGLAADDVFYFGNLPGDVDGDGMVGAADYIGLKRAFGVGVASPGGPADFDYSGAVGYDDLMTLAGNFGQSIHMTLGTPTQAVAGASVMSTVTAGVPSIVAEQTVAAVESECGATLAAQTDDVAALPELLAGAVADSMDADVLAIASGVLLDRGAAAVGWDVSLVDSRPACAEPAGRLAGLAQPVLSSTSRLVRADRACNGVADVFLLGRPCWSEDLVGRELADESWMVSVDGDFEGRLRKGLRDPVDLDVLAASR